MLSLAPISEFSVGVTVGLDARQALWEVVVMICDGVAGPSVPLSTVFPVV